MELTIEQINDFFKDLEFVEETHKYYVNGVQINKSVSGMIMHYYKPFERKEIGKAYAEARNITMDVMGDIPMYTNEMFQKQERLTTESVNEMWDAKAKESCDLGNEVHLFGEKYPYERSLQFTRHQEEQIKKFWDSLPSHIVLVGVEVRMYHKKYMFAGTADILLYNKKTKKYIIADYKTNLDLFKNFNNQMMLGKFNMLLDNPYNHYQLQLSFYQILLEQLGIEVENRFIIYLPREGEYKRYKLKDWTNVLKPDLKLIA